MQAKSPKVSVLNTFLLSKGPWELMVKRVPTKRIIETKDILVVSRWDNDFTKTWLTRIYDGWIIIFLQRRDYLMTSIFDFSILLFDGIHLCFFCNLDHYEAWIHFLGLLRTQFHPKRKALTFFLLNSDKLTIFLQYSQNFQYFENLLRLRCLNKHKQIW